jgi:hypothetical protein
MPLDLGNYGARLSPACCLVGEVGVVPPDLVRRSSDRALEQIADPVLQDLIGGQADRVLYPFPLKPEIGPRIAENFAVYGAHIGLASIAA